MTYKKEKANKYNEIWDEPFQLGRHIIDIKSKTVELYSWGNEKLWNFQHVKRRIA